jgi:hypothetical protein
MSQETALIIIKVLKWIAITLFGLLVLVGPILLSVFVYWPLGVIIYGAYALIVLAVCIHWVYDKAYPDRVKTSWD